MLTKNECFTLAHEIFMLESESDVAATASAVFNWYDDAVFFVAKQTLVDF